MKIAQHWPAILAALPLAAQVNLHADPSTRPEDEHLKRIGHVIVIYQENWSFDSLYGQFPGVNGLQNGFDNLPQFDKFGNPIYITPQPLNGGPDNRFPPGNGQPALPLIPWDVTKYVAADQTTGDIIHRFYHQQLQIGNNLLEAGTGNMGKFVTWSDNGGLVLSYIDATDLPEGKLAQQYTICDNFFHSAYGGSFLNHQFLVAATAPPWNQPVPAGFASSWDSVSKVLADNNLTIDGKYAVNTTYGAQTPHPNKPANQLMLPINDSDPSAPAYTPTIGDRLDAAGVSWRWYSGGWDNALNGHADPLFQYHHQPFAYYANYAPFKADGSKNPATTGPGAHLQDETQFFADVQNNSLPAVTFIKPLGPDNEHPGYASLARGQQHVADIISAVQKSKAWKDCVIVVTYDENGGRWDHVTPPVRADKWGVGSRVPGIIVSPFARKGTIDSHEYETVSILKLIERRYKLAPLAARDADPAVSDLTTALVFDGNDQ